MNITLIIIGVLMIIFVGWFAWSYKKIKNAPPVADHKNVRTLNKNNFRQYTTTGLVLLDFWAAWCAPCKLVAPILNEIAEEMDGKIRVGKINVDNQQELAAKFKIRNIPTLVLLKNGKEVKKIVGAKSKKALLSEISEFLN